MTVQIYSRSAVEKLLHPNPAASLLGASQSMLRPSFPDHAAVVSFYDGEPVDYSGVTERVFRVAMIDADIVSVGVTYELSLPEPLADELARNRSAGCAAAIREFFDGSGGAVFSDPRYEPDRSVYRSVLGALQREAKISGRKN